MTSKVFSIAHLGLQSQLVEVEADVSRHIPSFALVGLPDTAIQEARERIRSAIENSDLPFPRTKVTVNLAPAHLRKEGSAYDLAIAVSILRAHRALIMDESDAMAVFLGELALSGSVRPVKGILPSVSYARDRGVRRIYVPEANAREASYVGGIEIFSLSSLSQLAAHCGGSARLTALAAQSMPGATTRETSLDFAHIRGQYQAKRALEIASAGGHNILLSGAPGSGKTLLAKSFASILPPMTEHEMLEVSKIYSYAGMLSPDIPFVDRRPFRSPHHTASAVSIVGGGTWPKPGEVTLAHRGILFLDEFPEFPRSVLESLRQPLEDRVVTVSRISGSLMFPANFTLVAAQNPCPCGYAGVSPERCICTQHQRDQYERRVSGPLLDRIDLHVSVQPVRHEHLVNDSLAERSSAVLERILAARAAQSKRFANVAAVRVNADIDHRGIKRWCVLRESCRQTLLEAAERLSLSARSLYKSVKIARTIADLAVSEEITQEHVLEALQYRREIAMRRT